MYTYDIEQLLKDGSAIQLKPQGYSMYPLFHPGRDEAIIEAYPIDQLRRGDVILYRRDQGILVLHRICRITSDGFYLVGDNQTEIEGPLRPDQIRGKMTGVVRGGKSFSVIPDGRGRRRCHAEFFRRDGHTHNLFGQFVFGVL